MEPSEPSHWQTSIFLERACGTPAYDIPLLAGHLSSLRDTLKWTAEPPALASVSEAAAQLVEAKLSAGSQPAEMRALANTVGELLRGAGDTLAATEGAEGLRMLATRLRRHLDDVE
jgi:hypothetical protein